MSDAWFFSRDGQERGPVTWDQLQKLGRAGQLYGTDMVWTEGMDTWLSAAVIPELLAPAPSTAAKRAHAATEAPAADPNDKMGMLDVAMIIVFPVVGLIYGIIIHAQGKRRGARVIGYSTVALALVILLKYAISR